MVTYAITSAILVLGYTWAHKHVIKMLCQIIKHLDSGSRHSPGLKIWRMTRRGLNFNFKIHKGSLSQETFITGGLTFCFSLLLSSASVVLGNMTTSAPKEKFIPFNKSNSNNMKSSHVCGVNNCPPTVR